MAKLYLRFEQSDQVMKEVPLTQAATTIGRLPDNNLQIDNLAVSGHHARISWEQDHYVLTGKMTMIGKSRMASIRLKGFFAPTTAALISKRDNKYFIAPSEGKARLRINGVDLVGQRELASGDIIEVGKVKAAFSFQE